MLRAVLTTRGQYTRPTSLAGQFVSRARPIFLQLQQGSPASLTHARHDTTRPPPFPLTPSLPAAIALLPNAERTPLPRTRNTASRALARHVGARIPAPAARFHHQNTARPETTSSPPGPPPPQIRCACTNAARNSRYHIMVRLFASSFTFGSLGVDSTIRGVRPLGTTALYDSRSRMPAHACVRWAGTHACCESVQKSGDRVSGHLTRTIMRRCEGGRTKEGPCTATSAW